MDSSISGQMGQNRRFARRACHFCHKRKIRCDKEMPQCSSCRLSKRGCSYADDTTLDNSSLATVGSDQAPSHDQQLSWTAAIRFLDQDIFQRTRVDLPRAANSISPPVYVLDILGDHTTIRQMAARYFELIHPWIPIVSKRKFFDNILNPLLPPRAVASLLCLCMQLHTQPLLEDEDPRTLVYRTAVRYFSDLQVAGCLSIEILQGCVLTAIYELGHAIYPAAHVSIGVCVKHGLALGLNWQCASENTPTTPTWVDSEEHRRTWWTIFMIERIATLGDPQQAMITPDPKPNVLLPSHERHWEKERGTETATTLSSPPESLGRFASVAQASFLLSRVFQHASDRTMDPEFQIQEVEQLDRTLHALIRYNETNGGTTLAIICYQTAMAFSALMILYAPYLHQNDDPLHQLHPRAVAVVGNAANVALNVTQIYLTIDKMNYTFGDIPPFIFFWIYMAGVWFIREGSTQRLGVIENALRKLNGKWRVAGVYLKLLAARQVMTSL